MASIFGHGIVGFTISKTIDIKNIKWLVIIAIGSSILPDIDVLSFNFGIPYRHPLGHRGFTHSIIFAVLWSLLVSLTLGRKNILTWYLVIFLSTLSHGVLDAMTSGGKGVGFFIPFDNARYFFSLRPIIVSPLGIDRFFSDWGLQVILSELKFIFTPCTLILLMVKLIKR